MDEDGRVPNAGLVGPALLAQRLGIADLVQQRVRLDRGRPGAANSGAKALTVLGAMLAGGDSIEDTDVLRGSMTLRRCTGAVDGRDLAARVRLGQRPPARRGRPRDAGAGVEGRAPDRPACPGR